jgi:hypothetical protein
MKIAVRFSVLLTVLAMMFGPAMQAQNQENGNIYGAVTDASGGVIPGATATLTGSALIGQRTAVADSQGRYHFEQIPVGAYRIVFTQTGYQQLVRQNITITPGFSAQVDGQMVVGSVDQTVTVSATGPVIDTTATVATTELAPQQLVDELPVTRTLQDIAVTTPGIVPAAAPDLGGGTVVPASPSAYGVVGQATYLIEGIDVRTSTSAEDSNFDATALEAFQIIPTGGTAQTQLPGVYLLGVVKSGGNQLHGRFEITEEDEKFESNNLTPYIIAHGTTVGQKIQNALDFAGNMGGPLIKDKFWWFFGYHINRVNRNVIGYVRDDGSPGVAYSRVQNFTGKSSYQLSPNYKLIGFYTEYQVLFPQYGASALTAQNNTRNLYGPANQWKVEFQGTPNSRLVMDVFAGHHGYLNYYHAQPDTTNIANITDATTGRSFGPNLLQDRRPRSSWQMTDSVTYIPDHGFLGHHQLQAGSSWQYQWTITADTNGLHGNYSLGFQTVGGVAGTPVSLKTYNFPVSSQTNLNDGGFYVQDSWKMGGRVVVNLGLRYDIYHAWVPEQSKAAGQFGPPWDPTKSPETGVSQTLPRTEAGSWHNPAPRVGLVWDIFGRGKTVLKASYGRYNWTPGDDFATPFNLNTGTITTYKWTPTTGAGGCTEALALKALCDYVPGSVNLDPNGPNFQSVSASSGTLPNTQLNPDLKEQYTNNYQMFVEHEIQPNFSARVGYTYVQNRNTWQQVPILIPYSAWDIPYVVHDNGPTAATCLPTSTVTCSSAGRAFTIYDLDPAYKGTAFSRTQYQNRGTNRDDFFQTVTAVVTKRPTSGRWSLTASYTASKVHRWLTGGSFSPLTTSPNQLFSPVDTSWNWQSRITGNYKLPWKFDVAGLYELFNGFQGQRTATYSLPNSGGLTIPVEPFGAQESPARALLNMRFARDFQTDRFGTFRPSVELLNAANSASPWGETFTSGPSFGKYTTTDTPRIMRCGLVYSF